MQRYQLTIMFAFLLFAASFSIFAQDCKNNPVINDEKPICSFEVLTLFGVKTSEIAGIVIDSQELPISEAILELFEAQENGQLIEKYKTAKDGRFCFKNLAKGKYLLKVGWSKFGYNCSYINIEVKGKKKRLVTIPLQVGN